MLHVVNMSQLQYGDDMFTSELMVIVWILAISASMICGGASFGHCHLHDNKGNEAV